MVKKTKSVNLNLTQINKLYKAQKSDFWVLFFRIPGLLELVDSF